MAATLPYLAYNAAFEPDDTRAMSQAFDEACVSLRISPTQPHEREVVATRIIDLARRGLRDARALCDRVLSESRRRG
jgi:hypothetical protein